MLRESLLPYSLRSGEVVPHFLGAAHNSALSPFRRRDQPAKGRKHDLEESSTGEKILRAELWLFATN